MGWAKHAYEEKKLKDAQYHCYNSVVRASKALLTSKQAKTNSHASITQGFDLHFPEYETHFDVSFESVLKKNTATDCSEINILQFIEWTTTHLDWIKKTASNNE